MITLIAAIVFGLAFGLFATSNTEFTTLRFGTYIIPQIPIYMVVFGSLLIGLLAAWLLSSLEQISSWMALNQQTRRIKQSESAIQSLQTQIHSLEVENARLKGEYPATHTNYDEPGVEERKQSASLWSRLKTNVSY
jgi:cell shape-determining protein MreC